MSAGAAVEVDVDGRRLRLSNLDKTFYPAAGFTKGQVLDYYVRIAPALLPHLRDRPLTLKRYPDGVEGAFFYEKRCPSHRPRWVRTEAVWSEGNRDVIPYCVVNDLPTLVWVANLADLELHTPLHRAPHVERPTALVFDLDPGAPADAVTCCEVALLLRALLARLGLEAFAKTSGSKGVQVYVPLQVETSYGETKAFARAAAELLASRRPDLVVSSMKRSLRTGKVLIDWSQNDAHKTTVCVYSLRARERPTVSTPLEWEEVRRALSAADPAALAFEAGEVLARVKRLGDLFAPVLELRQRLPPPSSLPDALPRELRGAARVHASGAAPPPSPGGASRQPQRRKAGSGRRRPQATTAETPHVRPSPRPARHRRGGPTAAGDA
jgi:bifunctional non-homologous end joining protein LigD